MIHMQIRCGHEAEPRARDAKLPCDSTRAKNLEVMVSGVFRDAEVTMRHEAVKRGWILWALPKIGRRKFYICANCAKRARGEA